MLPSDTQTALFQNINSNNNWQVAPSISTLTFDVHCMENVSHICNIFLKLISCYHSPTSSRGNGMRSRHFLEYLQLKSSIQSKLNFAVIVPDLASASWELINICSSKKHKKPLKTKWELSFIIIIRCQLVESNTKYFTELTWRKKKVISRFISEILPYCVQNMLVSSDHPTSFCAAATQLWKDTRSLSVFQGCHYSPSLHLPKRHINNFNREKNNADYL